MNGGCLLLMFICHADNVWKCSPWFAEVDSKALPSRTISLSYLRAAPEFTVTS